MEFIKLEVSDGTGHGRTMYINKSQVAYISQDGISSKIKLTTNEEYPIYKSIEDLIKLFEEK